MIFPFLEKEKKKKKIIWIRRSGSIHRLDMWRLWNYSQKEILRIQCKAARFITRHKRLTIYYECLTSQINISMQINKGCWVFLFWMTFHSSLNTIVLGLLCVPDSCPNFGIPKGFLHWAQPGYTVSSIWRNKSQLISFPLTERKSILCCIRTFVDIVKLARLRFVPPPNYYEMDCSCQT